MSKKEIYRLSFKKSLPIMASYLFVSLAYGILMEEAGMDWYYSVLASLTIYTGAFQFMLTSLIPAGASILTIAITAFFMNSRQTFYALSFVDDFKKMGNKKLYMIQSMTDETYAVNLTLNLFEKDKHQVMFNVAILSQIYWIIGAVTGALIGRLIPFSVDGIDFCMTALFVIIFIDQWEKTDIHIPAIVGAVIAIICLIIFDENKFMLPALMIVSAILVVYNNIRLRKEK